MKPDEHKSNIPARQVSVNIGYEAGQNASSMSWFSAVKVPEPNMAFNAAYHTVDSLNTAWYAFYTIKVNEDVIKKVCHATFNMANTASFGNIYEYLSEEIAPDEQDENKLKGLCTKGVKQYVRKTLKAKIAFSTAIPGISIGASASGLLLAIGALSGTSTIFIPTGLFIAGTSIVITGLFTLINVKRVERLVDKQLRSMNLDEVVGNIIKEVKDIDGHLRHNKQYNDMPTRQKNDFYAKISLERRTVYYPKFDVASKVAKSYGVLTTAFKASDIVRVFVPAVSSGFAIAGSALIGVTTVMNAVHNYLQRRILYKNIETTIIDTMKPDVTKKKYYIFGETKIKMILKDEKNLEELKMWLDRKQVCKTNACGLNGVQTYDGLKQTLERPGIALDAIKKFVALKCIVNSIKKHSLKNTLDNDNIQDNIKKYILRKITKNAMIDTVIAGILGTASLAIGTFSTTIFTVPGTPAFFGIIGAGIFISVVGGMASLMVSISEGAKFSSEVGRVFNEIATLDKDIQHQLGYNEMIEQTYSLDKNIRAGAIKKMRVYEAAILMDTVIAEVCDLNEPKLDVQSPPLINEPEHGLMAQRHAKRTSDRVLGTTNQL